jgi:signal transduction histidine kinase
VLDEEKIANLYGQTQHLIHLVEDLRLLAQAEAHQLPLAIDSVNLVDLWRELAANFSLDAQEKGVQFRVEKMDQLPPFGRPRSLASSF